MNGNEFLICSLDRAMVGPMLDSDEKLTPADPRDVETALALALTSGWALARSQSAETMSKIVAERLVASLSASGFVIMRGYHRRIGAAACSRRLASYA
jgi:hypothetical protein